MRIIITFIACLFLMSPAINAAWWSGNAEDINISNDTTPDSMSSKQPRITAGPEGNLYCIWSTGAISGDGEIHFGKSTDNGVTWSSQHTDIMISADPPTAWEISLSSGRRP
jgi:hypothetical protein